ncbi:MAG: hypothetical protein HFE04_02490 [Bacilli bacterium]|nr:hypothetical protein [Bacilli bacterium]
MKKLTKRELENIKDFILGVKPITLSKRLKEEAYDFYMAMHLLLPEISFLKKVNEMGGIEMVVVDDKAQRKLSDIFEVEEEIVELRIRELYIRKLKEKEDPQQQEIINSSEKDVVLETIRKESIEFINKINEEASQSLARRLDDK